MSPPALGALLGLALGAGLATTFVRLPALRRPGLDERLAPYLRVPGAPGRAPGTVTVDRVRHRVVSVLGGGDAVRRRLDRAGRPPDVEAFRAEQVVWAAAGLLLGGVFATLLWWQRSTPIAPLLVAVLASGAAGFLGRDWALGRQVARREDQLLAEFPTVADLLALSVAAGEGAAAALDRVVRVSSGQLSGELGRALADVRAGCTLVEALGQLADRTGLPSLARFVDGVVVAVERGTPLGEVLTAQAQDVREARRRALIETAGRKEIGMMVPVVFLVLPVTVLFAVYPGFAFMRLSL